MFTIIDDLARPDALQKINSANSSIELFSIIHTAFIDVDTYDMWVGSFADELSMFDRECYLRYCLYREQKYATKVLLSLRDQIIEVVSDIDTRRSLIRAAVSETIAHCDAYKEVCFSRITPGYNKRLNVAIEVQRIKIRERFALWL